MKVGGSATRKIAERNKDDRLLRNRTLEEQETQTSSNCAVSFSIGRFSIDVVGDLANGSWRLSNLPSCLGPRLPAPT